MSNSIFRQIIQSTPFIHSVSLYSDQGLLLVSTEPDSSQMNLSDPALSPVWRVGMKRHLNDRHKEVKVLSTFARSIISIPDECSDM